MERPELAAELTDMAGNDLSFRDRLVNKGELFDGYHPGMRAIHRQNGDRLAAILAELGCWPGYRLVGEAGSEAAFLIAQHDIANPDLLRHSLRLYKRAVDNTDADPRRLAAIEDRIRYFEGRPQRYGTHVGWDREGRFGPWPPIEDPDTVDDRRAGLGLPPLAEAIETAAQDRPQRRQPKDLLDEHRRAEDFAREVGWRSSELMPEATPEQPAG